MSARDDIIFAHQQKGNQMKSPKIAELLEVAQDSIISDEITDEAKQLITIFQNADNFSQVSEGMWEYSAALASMVVTKVLHLLYTEEQVQELIDQHRKEMGETLVSEISEFLGGN